METYPGNRTLRKTVIGLCAFIMSTGPMCMIYLKASEPISPAVMLLSLALTILTLGGIVLTGYVFLPVFLYRDRVAAFISLLFITSLIINWLALAVDIGFRKILGLDTPLELLGSPWFQFTIFVSSLLEVFLLAGFAIWEVYDKLALRENEEKLMRHTIEEKSRLFRHRINLDYVRDALSEAGRLVETDPVMADQKIRSLSDYLRERLYRDNRNQTSVTEPSRSNPLVLTTSIRFLIEPRFRLLRHLCLIVVFFLLAAAMVVDNEYRPNLTPGNLIVTGCFFLFLLALAYANIYVIVPRFLKKHNYRKYFRNGLIIFGLLYIICSVQAFVATGSVNPNGVPMPWFCILLGTAGSMLTFVFLIFGTASIVLIKKNLIGKWEITRMETELYRMEFENLQAQVNPHFLFNVLNNACILSYDDPETARTTLTAVGEFLEYLSRETVLKETTVRREMEFLSNYLAMEKSSGCELDFTIVYDEEIRNVRIPVLLLIPLVENAAKHSASVRKGREIRIAFNKRGRMLVFTCENNYRPAATDRYDTNTSEKRRKSSGIGLFNTRRRLQLIYGDSSRCDIECSDSRFKVELTIPIHSHYDSNTGCHEMYDNR